MAKKSNETIIAELFTELSEASYAFHNGLPRTMTDNEYDIKERQYEELSGKKFTIGAPVNDTIDNQLSISHEYENLAGTLEKAQNREDFEEWFDKVVRKVKNPIIGLSIKADGHSVTVETEYDPKAKKTKICKALTRGSDGVGKDLTNLFKANIDKFFLPKIHGGEPYGLSYEAVMTFENFDRCIEENGLSYNNPRSIINAVFSEKGKGLFGYMTFLPLKIKGVEEGDIQKMDMIGEFNDYIRSEINFDGYFKILSDINSHDELLEEIWKYFVSIQETRHNDELPIMADGVVVEILNKRERVSLGYSSNRPKYAVAIKFEPSEQKTVLRNVVFSTEGTSGRHTPMAHFDPVKIDNNTYSKVSLANYARFVSMDLHEGDQIIFTRRNEVLGYVEKVGKSTPGSKAFKAPTVCNECGEELHVSSTGAFLECINNKCELNIVGCIMNALKAFDMKSIGRETVQKLFDNDAIINFSELVYLEQDYPLARKDNPIVEIPGLGKNVLELCRKLYDKIKNGCMDYQILEAMNIPMVGTSRAKSVCKSVPFRKMLEMSKKEWDAITIDDVGEVIKSNIVKFFESDEVSGFIDLLDLAKENIKYTYVSPENRKESMTFVHTGSALPFEKRKDLVLFLESKGHKVSGSVSAKTNFLVCNDVGSGSGKVKDATKHGVPVITVQEMIDKLS